VCPYLYLSYLYLFISLSVHMIYGQCWRFGVMVYGAWCVRATSVPLSHQSTVSRHLSRDLEFKYLLYISLTFFYVHTYVQIS
jgi:hypothetical protein